MSSYRSFLIIIHFVCMIINDYVCASFRMYALRNAKLIFKSSLHMFYRASSIHTIATSLCHFDQCKLRMVECAQLCA